MTPLELALLAAASGVVTAALAFAGFWLTLGGRLGKVEADSTTALQTAAEASEQAKEAAASVATLAASFSLYREHSIEKFVTHNAITEIERRLVAAQVQSESRLTVAIDGMNERLDRLIEAGLQRTHVPRRTD